MAPDSFGLVVMAMLVTHDPNRTSRPGSRRRWGFSQM